MMVVKTEMARGNIVVTKVGVLSDFLRDRGESLGFSEMLRSRMSNRGGCVAQS